MSHYSCQTPKPLRPVEVVNFTNEEGARFEPAMVGSGVLAGRYTPDFVYGRVDADGRSFVEELERIGYHGSQAARVGAIHAYLEVHIEQGPVLETEGLPLAAVEGIVGIRWLNLTLKGQSQHAGPSPMRSRRDAMVTAARIVVGLRDLALQYPDPVVTTVGRLRPSPGVINQIPGEVVMSADLRHWSEDGLAELAHRAEALSRQIAAEERVELAIETVQDIAPTRFDRRLVQLLEDTAHGLEIPCRRMTAAAAHDAKFIADLAPTAMLFVRTIGGKSHCETEAIDWDDVTAAANVTLSVVAALAEER